MKSPPKKLNLSGPHITMTQRPRHSTSSLESFTRPEFLDVIQSIPVSPNTSTQTPGNYQPHDATQQFTIDLNDLESTTSLPRLNNKLDTTVKDEQFLAESNETNGWINGYSVPYSLLRYGLASEKSTKIELENDHGDVQYIFNPICHLNEIEHSAYGRKDSSASTSHTSDEETEHHKEKREKFILSQDEKINAYSGYITIPKISYNIPSPLRLDKKQLRLMSDVPRLCYQNSFVVGDLTYVFGGLTSTKSSNFHHVGLPLDVDINKVSVHFPYKVPPFVDSKMLTTPFLHPNPHFIAYNAIRGTVTFVNTTNLKHFPGHLLSMQSTQITSKHYFFYGGFQIQNLSVKYHPEIGRWIINKKIVMNEDAYVLDSTNLKFIKIRLESNKASTTLGRIGMGICSNIYQPPSDHGEKISVGGEFSRPFENQRQSLPPAFSDASHKSSPSDQSASASVTRSNTRKATFDKNHQDSKRDEDDCDRDQHHRQLPQRETKFDESQMLRSKQPPSLQRIVTTHSIDSSLSDAVTRTSSASTSSPSSSKMDKIKSKFHRTNLKNTYSQKVREHRSNSTNNRSGASSRAVSPVLNATGTSSHLNPASAPSATSMAGSTSLDSATGGELPSNSTTITSLNPLNTTTSSIVSPPTTLTPHPSIVSPTVSNRPITPILQLQNKHGRRSSDTGSKSGHSTPPDDGRQSPKRNEREVLEFVRSYSLEQAAKFRSGRRHRGGSSGGANDEGAIVEDDDEVDGCSGNESTDDDECFETRTRSSNPLFNDSNILSNVNVFVFGGFYLDEKTDDNGIQHFKASNDLLKIDLTAKEEPLSISNFTFLPDALVSKVGSNPVTCDILLDEDESWPSPRGYFASYMIDYLRGLDEGCALDVGKHDPMTFTQVQAEMIRRSGSPDISIGGSSGSFHIGSSGAGGVGAAGAGSGGIPSGPGTGTAPSLAASSYEEPSEVQAYFNKRSFIVQGGCAEGNQFFADFYRFVFDTCRWEKFTTYAYDYFNIPLEPGADDDGSLYTKENMVASPELKEAELRCCHHTCVYYQNEERDYLFFLGGVKSDHLRFFDEIPYKSDKFDVSRLSRLPLMTNNTNTMRIAVLNIQTQTWRFMRYYYDINHAISDSYVDRIMEHPELVNARISHLAGSTTMMGKTLTLAQGLVIIAPEKKDDLIKLRQKIPTDEMLWGGIIQLTFAGL